MVIVVGLGNPDKSYEKTYHNMGFEVVKALAEKHNIKICKNKFKALVGEGVIGNEKVLLVLPQTYMNLSGECVVLLREKFRDAKILVVVDDIDLPVGTIRFRERGSAGTHNGLRSIVSFVGEEFARLKIGIGRDKTKDLSDFVLSKFDEETFLPIIERATKELEERIVK